MNLNLIVASDVVHFSPLLSLGLSNLRFVSLGSFRRVENAEVHDEASWTLILGLRFKLIRTSRFSLELAHVVKNNINFFFMLKTLQLVDGHT